VASLHHQVWIDAPVGKVFDALATAEGLGNWWVPHTASLTTSGTVLSHEPGGQHGTVRMLVVEAKRPSRVEWRIISSHPSRSPASAWTGTRIVFELDVRENPGHWLGIEGGHGMLTVLDFHHFGWEEQNEFLGFCNFAWAETLGMLRSWCEKR
jgi:uncharacterized protein YndB with AHSA1/START domain